MSHFRGITGYDRPPCDLPDTCEYCAALMLPTIRAVVAAMDDLFRRAAQGEPVTIGTHTAKIGMYRNGTDPGI